MAILSANCENEPGSSGQVGFAHRCTALTSLASPSGEETKLLSDFKDDNEMFSFARVRRRQVAAGRCYEIDSSMLQGVLKVHISAKLKRKPGI